MLEESEIFLTAEDLTPWGLELTQDEPDKLMKVWTCTERNSLIQKVVDIRWIFDTSEEAHQYHVDHLEENAEGSSELSAINEPFGQDLYVFFKDPNDPMLAMFNLEMNMFYFIFREKNVLAKVFISGSSGLTLDDATQIARAADGWIKGKF
ncbi:MAG: hypothetical protein ACFFD4_05635 [Candidatus Odinarchaeota archaeon]